MITIKQVNELNSGEWYITYTAPHSCMCRDFRYFITIKQKKKPTDKEIIHAINNQRNA